MSAYTAAAIAAELATRARDPLKSAAATLTQPQLDYLHTTAKIKEIIGGNQSGKTWTGCIDFLLDALGIHPNIKANFSSASEPWEGWWATESYELLGQQGFKHFKALLLFAGENIHHLPSRRVDCVSWIDQRREIPAMLRLNRGDGRSATINFKTYSQGIDSFASAQINHGHLDEECPMGIYEQLFMRIARRNGILSVSATPENSMPYIAKIRERHELRDTGYFYCGISTLDNPSISAEYKARALAEMKPGSELYNLRILGIPPSRKGLVYSDEIFTPQHVIEPFAIPHSWTRYRAADHGWNNFVCLWFAVSPSEDDIILYREYRGERKTIEQNAAAVLALTGTEHITGTVLDRATLGAAGTGLREDGKAYRIIDAYADADLNCRPSPQHSIWAGVAKNWSLLAEKGGPNGAVPKFRVFKGCEYFLEERRLYKSADITEHAGDAKPDKPDNPIKANDHAMDAWRYGVMQGLTFRPFSAPEPPQNTLAHTLTHRRSPREKRERL